MYDNQMTGVANESTNGSDAKKYDYETVKVEVKENEVATVYLSWPHGAAWHDIDAKKFHHEFPQALQELRDDDSVRIVVLRGAGDKYFLASSDPRDMELRERTDPKHRTLGDPTFTYAAIRENGEFLNNIFDMEKPVIAMVNGDAFGYGATVALASDIIIADEDAYINDFHIADASYFNPDWPNHAGVVPGDGGTVVWPLQMGLSKAKEYLFTGRPVKAKELAVIGAINYAVPKEKLQETVDKFVMELLRRPAWALAWTKVAINKKAKQNLNLTLDLSIALEALSMMARREKLSDGKGTAHL